jgi:hypothetical protein
MAITDKTRKMLWGRSGNRCAICRHELVTESGVMDEAAVIGDECHIVAREGNGPRGNNPMMIAQRDAYDNLILLCRNHHKEVDDKPNEFTVEILYQIKSIHEAWVQQSLNTRQSSDKETLFYAFRIDSGAQFCTTIIGCDALSFNNAQPRSEEEADILGDFAQYIQDITDMWSDIESKERIKAQFDIHKQIQELFEYGFIVYGCERTERYRTKTIPDPLDLVMGYVFVMRDTDELIVKKDENIENIMRQPEQNTSEYTHFIPILRKARSLRFV